MSRFHMKSSSRFQQFSIESSNSEECSRVTSRAPDLNENAVRIFSNRPTQRQHIQSKWTMTRECSKTGTLIRQQGLKWAITESNGHSDKILGQAFSKVQMSVRLLKTSHAHKSNKYTVKKRRQDSGSTAIIQKNFGLIRNKTKFQE